jgi:cytoskeletal protein RodZ
MSIGSLIAQARKSAGLSIEELSESTNIRSTLLREMEANNFSGCGGETYARGHVRNIAIKLNVDPQIFVTAFEDEHMQLDRSMQDLLIENSVMKESQETRKVSWKVLVAISVSSLCVVGLAQIIISNTSSTDAPDPLITTSQTQSASPSASASASATATSQASPTAQATVSSGTGVELIIFAARGKSWLFVSDAAGRTLFSGQIARGTTKTFTTDVSLNVKVGNAGGVDLTVNGKKVDSIGADGEVVSVSYGVDS